MLVTVRCTAFHTEVYRTKKGGLDLDLQVHVPPGEVRMMDTDSPEYLVLNKNAWIVESAEFKKTNTRKFRFVELGDAASFAHDCIRHGLIAACRTHPGNVIEVELAVDSIERIYPACLALGGVLLPP